MDKREQKRQAPRAQADRQRPEWALQWEKALEILEDTRQNNLKSLAHLGYSQAWQERAQQLMGRIDVLELLLDGGLDSMISKSREVEESLGDPPKERHTLSGRIPGSVEEFARLLEESSGL